MEVVTAVKGSSVLLRLTLRWWVDIHAEKSWYVLRELYAVELSVADRKQMKSDDMMTEEPSDLLWTELWPRPHSLEALVNTRQTLSSWLDRIWCCPGKIQIRNVLIQKRPLPLKRFTTNRVKCCAKIDVHCQICGFVIIYCVLINHFLFTLFVMWVWN